MALNLATGQWGGGWLVRSTAHEGQGSAADAGLTDVDLQRLSAKEAIESLEGEFASGKMPDIASEVSFPGPIAEAFYWSDDDVVGIQGPVGSGKTTTLMKSRMRRAVMMPRSSIDGVRRYKVLFIRETYRQLWSTSIPSYLETFPKDMGTWSGGRGDPVTHVIHFEDEYGPIEFIAEFMAFGDDIIASMRGVQTTDIVLNEMDTMPVEILTVGIGRIDRFPAREHFAGLPLHLQSYGQIVGDFNAPDEENWTFTVFHNEEERKRMGELLSAELPEGVDPIVIQFYNQPGYGEPGCENTQNLSPTYYPRQIASMKLAGRGDMIKRLVRNKITYLKVGDPVWEDEYNSRIHVSDIPLVPDPRIPLRIGLDQGYKGAAVIAQYMPGHRWRIYGEAHYPKKRLMAVAFGKLLADLLDERFGNHRVEFGLGDMAGEHGSSTAADENATWNLLVGKAAGFKVRPQRIGTNRIQPRLEAVRAMLDAPLEHGEPGLLIDPSCKFLIRGFEARYVWAEEIDRHGDKRKVPNKQFTEANVHDALQYLLLSEHRGDGTSPQSFPGAPGQRNSARPPHPGNLKGQPGLRTGYDILNPYGD
ncbi:MAG: hypothetical protein AAF891_00150 [Pseudomonadota bacterium]